MPIGFRRLRQHSSLRASNFPLQVPHRMVRPAACSKKNSAGHATRRRRMLPPRSQLASRLLEGASPRMAFSGSDTQCATIHSLHRSPSVVEPAPGLQAPKQASYPIRHYSAGLDSGWIQDGPARGRAHTFQTIWSHARISLPRNIRY
jgi:hypothetical protein